VSFVEREGEKEERGEGGRSNKRRGFVLKC
jgi:hypothetical protein